MTTDDTSKTQQFKKELQNKIQHLLEEFSEGLLSREQFQILYERYHHQLMLTERAEDPLETGMSTIAIRDATTGKAIGTGIFHHPSGSLIEIIGRYDVPADLVGRVVNEHSISLDKGLFIAPKIESYGNTGQWIVFTTRLFTTAITLFQNEPSPKQTQDLQRLHHDFERANQQLLAKPIVAKDQLAVTFKVIIKREIGQ
ncbi:hypothetical protein MASR2M15_00850 [Anaerolineales bacterium]